MIRVLCFLCLDFFNGFNLYVLPATTLQATNNVVEGSVIRTYTPDDDGCNAIFLRIHLDGAGACKEMYIVLLGHHGNDLFLDG